MQLATTMPIVREQLDDEPITQIQVHYTGKRIATLPVVNIVLPDGTQRFVFAHDLIAASEAVKAALSSAPSPR